LTFHILFVYSGQNSKLFKIPIQIPSDPQNFQHKMEVLTKCDKRVLDSLNKNVCLLCKELKDFKTNFQSMVLEQKKAAERLWVLVVRYQVLSR
jgi:hypothetical protein